jgi:uncharacterized membrane protein YjfL (UPF0719 family)
MEFKITYNMITTHDIIQKIQERYPNNTISLSGKNIVIDGVQTKGILSQELVDDLSNYSNVDVVSEVVGLLCYYLTELGNLERRSA